MSSSIQTDAAATDCPAVWAEVNLNAVQQNFTTIRAMLREGSEIFPVIKADAYGHGALKVAEALAEIGTRRFCVARVDEALALRNTGISQKLLVFAPPSKAEAAAAAGNGLECVVCHIDHLNAIQQAQSATGKDVAVHIKIDIGMGRLGIPPADARAFLDQCEGRNIAVAGIMTHFPCADSPDESSTVPLIEEFAALRQSLKSIQPNLIFHAANTAATLRYKAAHFDAVRCGIGLYGLSPTPNLNSAMAYKPAMAIQTKVLLIKWVEAGTGVSYCHTYRTNARALLATVAVGYADGLPRLASNRSHVVFRGHRLPQVGTVCMDQMVVDATSTPDLRVGDSVLIFGNNSSGSLPVEELAKQCGTINYEIVSRIGARVPRIYVK